LGLFENYPFDLNRFLLVSMRNRLLLWGLTSIFLCHKKRQSFGVRCFLNAGLYIGESHIGCCSRSSWL